MGLNSLPAPKNDYEIVVPEDEEDNVDMKVSLPLFLSPSLFLLLPYSLSSAGRNHKSKNRNMINSPFKLLLSFIR